METLSVSPRPGTAVLARLRVGWGAVLLAAACPIVFLHIRYQPGFQLTVRSTSLNVELSDIAIVVVALAALLVAVRERFAALRPALPLWIVIAAFFVWTTIESFRPFVLGHLVTDAKFAEYALLAFSVPVLLRRRDDFDLVFAALTIWSTIATGVALAQFAGAKILGAWPTGRRQPSFLGHLDFAALSGMVLVLGLVALLVGAPLRRSRALTALAIVAGGLGLALAGGSAGLIGIVAAAVGTALVAGMRRGLSARRVLAPAVIVAIVAAGVLTLRAGDYDQFLRFAGLERAKRSTHANVQTYAQHTLLAYVGWRIFLAHPLLGAGWQESSRKRAYGPVLPAVHRRFPHQPAIAFPSPAHPYGIQNAYVQALAELGPLGELLWLGLFACGLVVALRARPRAPPALVVVAVGWILLTMGLWIPQGLVAGVPLDALMWLALGTAAAAASLGAVRARA